MFFSIDGLDGVGKSTQLQLFEEWLRALGHEVITCQDPGSTPLGTAIRQILLGREIALGRPSEMLLFMAARAQMVDEVIAPALAAGKVVISDRYLLANVVYQGHAGGLDVAEIWRIGRMATHGVLPEMTFVLDMAPERAAARIGRPLDRMESRGAEFRTRLRAGYLAEASQDPQRIRVIDASRSIDEVQAELRSAAAPLVSIR
ncbi:MAG TPA: dTMP kinase [Pirellulales bacterium]|jgi:dTMP kinase|nr:dTMP kinase [Pirellulales bacterium]